MRLFFTVIFFTSVFTLSSQAEVKSGGNQKPLCKNTSYDLLDKIILMTNDYDDKAFLSTLMKNLYGADANYFIEKMDRGTSTVYTKLDSKHKKVPLITNFTMQYKNSTDRDLAFERLTQKSKSNNYHFVFKSELSVFWFGNNNVSSECFEFFKKNTQPKN